MKLDLFSLRFATVAISVVIVAAPMQAQAQSVGLPPSVASAGVTQAQWQAVEQQVQAIASRANVSERALLAAARATSERLAQSGRFDALALQSAIVEALDEQAEQITELQARLETLTGDADPGIAPTFAEARRAIDEGRLDDADRLLANVAQRDLAALQTAESEVERRRLRAGETIATRGQVAFLQAGLHPVR